jgi:multidrug efflux pump subunit AcrB
MITVPLALAGALLSLFIFNQTLNIFLKEIGMIMLIGLVTKNEYFNCRIRQYKKGGGLDKTASILQGITTKGYDHFNDQPLPP